MMPVLRRTWAPCGLTPTLSVRTRSHEKVSGIGALIVSPRRRQLTLALARTRDATFGAPRWCAFFAISGATSAVHSSWFGIGDALTSTSSCRAGCMLIPRCHIVWFPPYAPDLNPVELLWSYLKYGRLANLAPDTVDDIQSNVRRERRRLTRHPQLLRSFFRHSALPFRV